MITMHPVNKNRLLVNLNLFKTDKAPPTKAVLLNKHKFTPIKLIIKNKNTINEIWTQKLQTINSDQIAQHFDESTPN